MCGWGKELGLLRVRTHTILEMPVMALCVAVEGSGKFEPYFGFVMA